MSRYRNNDDNFWLGCFGFIAVIIIVVAVIGGSILLIQYIISIDQQNVILPYGHTLERVIATGWVITKDTENDKCYLVYSTDGAVASVSTEIFCDFLKMIE